MVDMFSPFAGRSLKDLLNELGSKGETLKLYNAMSYWYQILDALRYLYNCTGKPLLHKDIKAENVFLPDDDNLVRVKLGDYDTVKRLYHNFTPPGLAVRGTLGFFSPEVFFYICVR